MDLSLVVTSSYVTILAYLLLYVSEENDTSYLETFHFEEPKLNESYDFIIIGAGSAGSVLANRLSEVNEWTILLVEAGDEEDVISDTPMMALNLWNTEKDWNYTTVEQKYACRDIKGICEYPRGRVMGGSSTINFLNYVRGNRFDYDNWENQGNQGWSYKDVLPYFLKSEDMRIESLANSKYHSTGGYLTIERSPYVPPLQNVFLEAAHEMGLPFTDFNGENQIGVGYPQLNMRNGSRCSTSKAFLSVIKNRPNIHISKRTLALKINLNENSDKAESVTLLKDGRNFDVKAAKEVILSSGSINSPKLLMLSGIGPKENLEEVGIRQKLDLPVGQNLVDHVYISVYFKLKNSVVINANTLDNAQTLLDYISSRSGPLSSPLGIEVVGHINLNKSLTSLPEFQIFMSDFVPIKTIEPTIYLMVAKLRPESIGDLKLRSSDPSDHPLIDPQFFKSPIDYKDAVQGCLFALDFMSTKAFSKYEPEVYGPGNLCHGKKGKAYCKCAVKNFSNTMYHPTGTARMDKRGVVTSKLQVKGVPNLRVIDASIMPNITSGNLNAPTIMIAEKGADIIKSQWGLLDKI